MMLTNLSEITEQHFLSENTFYFTNDQCLKGNFPNEKHWIFNGFPFEKNWNYFYLPKITKWYFAKHIKTLNSMKWLISLFLFTSLDFMEF